MSPGTSPPTCRLGLIALPGNEDSAAALASELDAEVLDATIRRFPDGETYVRLGSDPEGRDLAVVATLDRPDPKTVPLLLTAATARDLGARTVGLVAPYLGYMRQDSRFLDGEGITSKYFARLVSTQFDWLATVDPHLHRWTSLADVYTIPGAAVAAAPAIAAWVRTQVPRPFLVGPDEESAQWVSEVGRMTGAPHVVLDKVRRGDEDVEITVPSDLRFDGRTPVLVDDVISTAGTLLETVRLLKSVCTRPPVCIGVHAVFSGNGHRDLLDSGVERVVTCNTIPHESNGIDVLPLLADAVRGFGARPKTPVAPVEGREKR